MDEQMVTQRQAIPAVLAAGEQAWSERLRQPYPTTAELRAAATMAGYWAGLAAATPSNDGGPSSCWALRRRADGALKCIAHSTNGGVQLAKILAAMPNPRTFELIRWDGSRWVVVGGVA